MTGARIPCPNCGSDLAHPLIQIEEGRCRSCGEVFDAQHLVSSTMSGKPVIPADEDAD